jgi:2-dehydropantoate 2-reductase
MRVLILGAGGVGGYFGARLLETGRDVTFLVRPARAERLARSGLKVQSPCGDIEIPVPPAVTADTIQEPFDLILLSCKAYDLEDAVRSITPAVGEDTLIVPLLNGMRHMDVLDERFGRDRVLGGFCAISSTVDPEGRILHLNRMHTLVFGSRLPSQEDALDAIDAVLTGAGYDGSRSDAIVQEMWEKWVFIAAGAGITCLMRASIGDIVTAAGPELSIAMLEETGLIAAANDHPPGREAYQRSRRLLTDPASSLTASMLRDVETGSRTEADHILGDLIRRRPRGARAPMLDVAYAHLLAYEARRAREGSTASQAGAVPASD